MSQINPKRFEQLFALFLYSDLSAPVTDVRDSVVCVTYLKLATRGIDRMRQLSIQFCKMVSENVNLGSGAWHAQTHSFLFSVRAN